MRARRPVDGGRYDDGARLSVLPRTTLHLGRIWLEVHRLLLNPLEAGFIISSIQGGDGITTAGERE
jgi:hypothetical protein